MPFALIKRGVEIFELVGSSFAWLTNAYGVSSKRIKTSNEFESLSCFGLKNEKFLLKIEILRFVFLI